MSAISTNSFARAPLWMLMAVEAVVFYSSVYFAVATSCGALTNCNDIVGPMPAHALIVTTIMLISLVAMGLYQLNERMIFRQVVIRLIVGVASGALVVAALYYFVPAVSLTRSSLAISAIYSVLCLSLLRFLFLSKVDQHYFRRKTLIFGSGERAASINKLRRGADRRGFKIVGTVKPPYKDSSGSGDSLIKATDSLLDVALDLEANEIVIAIDDRRGALPVRELLECRLYGIEVIDIIGFLERETGKIRADLVNPGWLTYSRGFRKTRLRLITKRAMDLLLSTAALAIGWPLLLAIAVAIKAEDGWNSPVLYRQDRVGFNGILFTVLKFRSMVVNAEEDGKPVWAIPDDDRITKVGRFIRKFRLDELPQIFNVIRGQMSIVGPRPERPLFVEQLSKSIPYYAARHTVIPGITGWAQLRYSYGASEDDAVEKLHYDLYYVKHNTMLFDLRIILQTVEVVLWGKGAR